MFVAITYTSKDPEADEERSSYAVTENKKNIGSPTRRVGYIAKTTFYRRIPNETGNRRVTALYKTQRQHDDFDGFIHFWNTNRPKVELTNLSLNGPTQPNLHSTIIRTSECI